MRIQSGSSKSSRAGAASSHLRMVPTPAVASMRDKAGKRPGTRSMRFDDTPSAAASATALSE